MFAFVSAACSDIAYASLVIVAPPIRSICALWSCSTSCFSIGIACELMNCERGRSVG
jgi:hypothetical protein